VLFVFDKYGPITITMMKLRRVDMNISYMYVYKRFSAYIKTVAVSCEHSLHTGHTTRKSADELAETANS